jgi:hypothetical protein
MSTPANILDQFRSFSYHHFIIVANNTEALRQLQTGQLSFSALSALTHGQTISTTNSSSGSSSIVMVINSEVDSKFYLESVSYQTMFMDVSQAGKQMTAATKMEMVIRETGGATFLNFLNDLSNTTLQASFDSCCFLLKTFFVGHRDDGTVSAPIQVQPIPFIIAKMDSSFDHTGGVHTIEAVAMTMGAPLRNNSLLYVNRNLSLNSNTTLLKDMLADLESKLNKQLALQYTAVKQATGGNGRQVKYKFTIPNEWSAYTVKSLSKDNFIEQLFPKEQQAVQQTSNPQPNSNAQSGAGPESDQFKTSINTAVKVTVIQILSEIFKHCDQIQKNFVDNVNASKNPSAANTSTASAMPKLYQTVSSITSDDTTMTIHFDTVTYYLPSLPSADSSSSAKPVVQNTTKGLTQDQQNAVANTQAAVRKSDESKYGIIFDFIFTGKNSDIITFDIKANGTNVLIQSNRTTVNGALQSSVVNGSNDPTQVVNTNKDSQPVVSIRKNDPVYLPELTAEAQQGYTYKSPSGAKINENFKNLLAQLVAITTSKSHLVIRGNPAFLNQMIMPLMAHDDTAYQAALDARATDAKTRAQTMVGTFDPTTSVSYMGVTPSSIPIFCKIRMMTPIVNPTNNTVTYEEFWYKGYYRINFIDNKFVNGEFTQELTLYPWDIDDLALTNED